jgi:hypothetical protein
MTLPEAWLPWLAVAGLGALHGMNPANGWLFLAADATRRDDRCGAQRRLVSLAVGHAASVALVVAAVMHGVSLDRADLVTFAGSVLIAMAVTHAIRRRGCHMRAAPIQPSRPNVRLALWSCLMGTAHGSGLMLVPALVPLCVSGPARAITATGSLALMLVAVMVHLLAMLLTTQAIAAGVCRSLRHTRLACHTRHLASLWTLALAITGAALIATR